VGDTDSGRSGAGGSSRRRAAAAAFTSALWGMAGGEPGTLTARDDLSGLCVSIFTIAGPGQTATEWWPADEPWAIADRLVALDAEAQASGRPVNIYVGATLAPPRDELPREGGKPRARPHAEDAAALLGVWADIDVAELGGHSDRPYPPTEADARALLARLPIAPTLVLHTGHGLQAWWLLHEPWRFDDDPDPVASHTRAADLARDWVNTLRLHAEDAGGWHLDPVGDLARLMRPAGTTNRKGDALPVTITDGPGRTFDVEDIESALADPKVLERYRTPKIGPEELGGIDLHRCWARATSLASRERGFVPPWVEVLIDADVAGPLADAFGAVDYGSDEDPSTVDARISRWLFDRGCTTEQVCEVIMCLRLKTGHKPDKVDPNRRTDYLITTVGKFRATSAAAKAKRDGAKGLVEASAAAAVKVRAGEGELAPAPREDVGVTPAAPEPVATRAPDTGQAPGTGDAPEDISAAVDAAVRAPQPHDAHARTDEPTPDDGAAEATHEPNDAGDRSDTAGRETDPAETETDEPLAHDGLAQHAIDRLRHPADTVGGWEGGESPRATPPPAGASGGGDPFGKRTEIEAQFLAELTSLLINPMYVDEGVEVWRVEQRNTGPRAEGRMILRLPEAFAWESGAPPGYKPGRPFATGWRPRVEFENYKGWHQSLRWDAKIIPREVAAKGAEVQEHQADTSTWRAILDALVPHWRRDSSGTDMATAVPEWLFNFLIERPALRDADEALSTGRSWLAADGGWSAEAPPQILVPRGVLIDYMAAQPGSPGAGPASGSLLELLDLTPRRVRTGGTHVRRTRWLEVAPGQFDAERWSIVVEDTAAALQARERQQQARHGLRLVADGETTTTATEAMRAELAEHDVTLNDAAAVGEAGRSGQATLDTEGDR
jgi:hypothetical protein